MLRTAPRSATPSTKAGWCDFPITAAICLQSPRRHRHRLRRAHAGNAAAVSHAAAARAVRKGRRGARGRGIPYEVLDPEGCNRTNRRWPGARKDRRRPGCPKDETGDCFKFTQHLAAKAEALGVRFAMASTIKRLVSKAARSGCRDGAAKRSRPMRSWSRSAAIRRWSGKDHGVDLPVYPVKGYSLTMPIKDASRPGIDDHGRDLQGRDHAAGRPHPGGRHGRNRRHTNSRCTAQAHAGTFGDRPFPRRRYRSRPRSGGAFVR